MLVTAAAYVTDWEQGVRAAQLLRRRDPGGPTGWNALSPTGGIACARGVG